MVKKGLIVLILFVFSLQLVNAGSVGITPAKQELLFEPGLVKTYVFKVYAEDPSQVIDLYVGGDLAEYFTLSNDTMVGSGRFEVHVKLPNDIEKPGKHRVLIGAKQHVEEFDGNVKGVVAIQSPIDVMVPYPGKYAEADFRISDVNQGEDVIFELEVFNFGKEKITPIASLDIFNNENKTKKIKSITIVSEIIESNNKFIISDKINTSNLAAGQYYIDVSLDYGKIIKMEDEFKIGVLSINISDYTYEFQEKIINRFNIEVESLWNNDIDSVYAEVSVTDNGKIIDIIKTPSIVLKAWGKANLTGFFDARELGEGKYLANLKVFYRDKSVYKLVNIYVREPGLNSLMVYGGVAIFISLLLVLFLIFSLLKKIRKLEKNGRRK